ncbi:MAG TPA: hypothetical protein VFB03_02900 [Candidatus Saccharimonadales bacterium]|nr:hypothetical protein [Candidatus Saccharimonadales bacterium]
MFKKLVANLPFNPSLIDEVVGYGKKTRQEVILRKLGLWFVLLAVFIQGLIFLHPPQQSGSDNGLLPMVIGFSTAVIAGYLYARSKIIALELEIIRLSFVTTGGL